MDKAQLQTDGIAAKQRGLIFSVCRKEKRHAKWTGVLEGIADLPSAIDQAKPIEAYEVAVFTQGPEPLGGYMYWTSRDPETLNSTVITHAIWQPTET